MPDATTPERRLFLTRLRQLATQCITAAQGQSTWSKQAAWFVTDEAMKHTSGWLVGDPIEEATKRSNPGMVSALCEFATGLTEMRELAALALLDEGIKCRFLPGIDPNPDESEVVRFLENYLLFQVFDVYLQRLDSPTIAWSETTWQTIRDLAAAEIGGHEPQAVITTPLEDFTATVDRIDVHDHLWIDRVSMDEKREQFTTHDRADLVPHKWRSIASWTHAIRQLVPAPHGGAIDDTETKALITALRLANPGRVAWTSQWWGTAEPTLYRMGGGSGRQGSPARMANYVWAGDNASTDELAELVSNVVQHRTSSDAAIGLRRFESLYDRHLVEDRILDAWIGLEAIFAKSGERNEITYRLALRIALLLGSDLPERTSLRREVSRLYGVRSATAHGAGTKVVEVADVEETEELLRRGLRKKFSGSSWTVASIEDDMLS